ncbi:DUF3488 and transglutaminase-like domain-containing protein [Alicyclobacillus mengziensis]|uniref:Transglutaminase-like domain-containing protein n=1 Tax=Alicyclobacillus mengziensis TaxID=2931921 RepID=A0A9X7Z792_9BACL|nr:transglutaminase domain-containing protein [Alicyclobacillus mengziensis]QSO46968.1 hypothetical protein JZ786_21540 [Alicyclobacillus mengziensis]
MPQRYADQPNLLFRLLIGVIAAAWLYAFLPPMQKLGLLQGASTILAVLLMLVFGQVFRWRFVRLVLAVVAIIGYAVVWWVHAPNLFASVLVLFRENWHEILLLFHSFQANSRPQTEPLQTELFLSVLVVVYWLVVYAALRPKLWTFYNFLAVLVLGIVDGNTSVHPNTSIVVQLLLFVALLGVVQFRRLSGQLIYRGQPFVRFFLPLTALLLAAAGFGFVIPKPGPVWADPFARIDNSTGGAGSAMRQIGYQMNNAKLGGSFVANHDPVLSVIAAQPTYLRGAVYSIYTGHGWLPGNSNMSPISPGEPVSKSTLQFQPKSGVSYTPLTQQVTVLSNNLHVPVLFAAYAPEKLVSDKTKSPPSSIDVNTETDVLYGAPLTRGQTYTVTSYQLQPPDAILSTLPSLPKNHAAAFPNGIASQYLQLPSTLPQDIKQLTQSLTSGMTSEYDMVVTVENYLKLNYTYATQGIPVPGPKQDYVSQFLFDSKKGYCNNFSSSMAVMLRTIGIPTRWVTGFTEGTMDPQYNGKDERFVITNADAHSWVEVYFPTVGWIPFDPTPQFDMTYAPDLSSGTVAPVTPPKAPVTTPAPPVTTPASGSTSSGSNFSIPWGTIFRVLMWVVVIAAAVGLVMVLLFRHKISDRYHQRKWRSDSPDGLKRGILHLVRLLMRVGDVKKQSPTIRDLYPAARSYDVPEPDFRELVETFEGLAYGGLKPGRRQIRKVRQTWTRWILEVLRRGR